MFAHLLGLSYVTALCVASSIPQPSDGLNTIAAMPDGEGLAQTMHITNTNLLR